jgi:hypothetical protein
MHLVVLGLKLDDAHLILAVIVHVHCSLCLAAAACTHCIHLTLFQIIHVRAHRNIGFTLNH